MLAALGLLLRGGASDYMRREIGGWAIQLAAAAVLCAIVAAGGGFLLAAAYLALGDAGYSPAHAALLIGLALMGSALLVVLVAALSGRRRSAATLPVPAERAAAREAGDRVSEPQTLDQLHILLRDSPPLAAAAIVAGLIVGVFLRTRTRTRAR